MKWVYNSIILNLCSAFCLLTYVFIKNYPIDAELMDIAGFYYTVANVICFLLLIFGYIIELYLHFKKYKYALKFPYNKIKIKILYYICFYLGCYLCIRIALPFLLVWIKNPNFSAFDVFVYRVLF